MKKNGLLEVLRGDKLNLLIIISLLLLGCNKDTDYFLKSTSSSINNAKEWYLNTTKDHNISFGTLNQRLIKLQLSPTWEMATNSVIEGVNVVTTPVETNLSKILGENTSFFLVISKDRSGYTGKIVSIKTPPTPSSKIPRKLEPGELYDVAFDEPGLAEPIDDNLIIKTFNLNLTSDRAFSTLSNKLQLLKKMPLSFKLNLSNGPFKNNNIPKSERISYIPLPPPEGCVDWYLVTSQYDSEGVMYNQFWEFLDRICEGPEFDENSGGDNETEVKNKVKNVCLYNMVQNVLNSKNIENKIALMIDSVFGGSTAPSLIIEDKILPDTIDGAAFSTPAGSLIQLNVDLKDSSQEYIAATIMHEALHVYMGHCGIILDVAHEAMAKDYVDVMANILKQIYSHIDISDAKKLAWGGLQGTSIYKNPPPTLVIPPDVNTVNLNYRNNSVGMGCNIENVGN